MSLPRKRRKSGSKNPKRSRATKEQRVAVTREIVEAARHLDGPEIDSIALKVHRALDGEEWYEAKMNLATMTGQFDERFDTALRLNMALLEELEQASADGKFTAAEKKKVEKVKKSVDTMQKSLLDDYWAGSISGVAKKRMTQEPPQEDKFAEVRKKRQRLEAAREKVAAGGSIEHVKEMKKNIEERGGKVRIVDTGKDTITTPSYRIYDLIQTYSEAEWKRMQDAERKWQVEEERQSREWTPAKTAKFEVHQLGHHEFTFLEECATKKEAETALLKKLGPQGFDSDYRFHIQPAIRGQEQVHLAYYYKLTPTQLKAKRMDYLDQIKVIRKWVKKHVPTLSVRRGTGTAYSYIEIGGTKPLGRNFTEREKDGLKKLGLPSGGNFAIIGPDDTDYWTVESLQDLEKNKR